MTKKILLLLLASLLSAILLIGCGNTTASSESEETTTGTTNYSSDYEQITLSEMLENELEENDGEIYIYTTGCMTDHTLDEILELTNGTTVSANVYKYDGSSLYDITSKEDVVYITNYEYFTDTTFEDATLVADAASDGDYINVVLAAHTDSSSGLTLELIMDIDENDDESVNIDNDTYEINIEDEDGDISSMDTSVCYRNEVEFYNGSFFHVTIDGESYMVFDYGDRGDEDDAHYYTIIKDTDYTVDKNVVFDDPTTDTGYNVVEYFN